MTRARLVPVEEYLGLAVGETMESWSVMETVTSVFGVAVVMVVSVLATWCHPWTPWVRTWAPC